MSPEEIRSINDRFSAELRAADELGRASQTVHDRWRAHYRDNVTTPLHDAGKLLNESRMSSTQKSAFADHMESLDKELRKLDAAMTGYIGGKRQVQGADVSTARWHLSQMMRQAVDAQDRALMACVSRMQHSLSPEAVNHALL